MSDDHVKAWQCIGCGSIEAPQPCIGICSHRRVEFVYADEHERALGAVRARIEALERLLRQLVGTHPRTGQHEATLRAFQAQARKLLTLGRDPGS